MRSLDSFIQSPMVRIHFSGFRATSLELQHNGWALSAYERIAYDHAGKSIQLMMNHREGGITMVSQVTLMSYQSMLDLMKNDMSDFHVCGVSFGGQSRFMPMVKPMDIQFKVGDFAAIDAMPSYDRVDLGKINLEEFGVFRKLNDMANIYLPEKTVDELLKEILQKQAPKQADIRKRERKEQFMRDNFLEIGRKPNESIRAQLIAV